MSRSGYSDDYDFDNWAQILWRGTVASSIRGKRGQAFLRDLIAALDTMPEKRLIKHDLINRRGAVCAIGSVGVARGIDMTGIDPEDYERIADTFGVASPLVREIEFMNDEDFFDGGKWTDDPEERWQRMRAWAVSNLKVRP